MASNIHEAIIEVMGEVGYVQKQKKGGLSYSFAGEAAFIKAVRPVLVAKNIFVYPFAVEDIRTEGYETSKGTHMNRTIAKFGFRFVHAPSDTSFEAWVLGQGADVGDKDANKAMTAALKYALRQSLLIETGDDPDETPSHEQERSPRELKSSRPYSPEKLKETIAKMSLTAVNNQTRVTGRDRQILAGQLTTLCVGEETRYKFTNRIIDEKWEGKPSLKEAPANVIYALLRWLDVDDFDTPPSDVVMQEAKSALEALK